jgi:hypothetical protein
MVRRNEMKSKRFLNVDAILQIENNVYGHSAILRKYAGVDDKYIIPGILQHGWNMGAGFGYVEDRSDLLQKYVWSKVNIDRIKSSNSTRYQAVGSPWIYLPTDLEIDKKTLELCSNRKLVFIHHQTNSEKHDLGAFADLMNRWKSDIGSKAVFCLHPSDYYDIQVASLFRENNLLTVTMGGKGVLPHHDPAFLYNLKAAISVCNEVVVNEIGTPVLYAGHLNKKITISGYSTYQASDHEKEAKKFVENYGHTEEMKQFSDLYLGVEHKLSPEELISLFSWESILKNKAKNNYYVARIWDLFGLNREIIKSKTVRFY